MSIESSLLVGGGFVEEMTKYVYQEERISKGDFLAAANLAKGIEYYDVSTSIDAIDSVDRGELVGLMVNNRLQSLAITDDDPLNLLAYKRITSEGSEFVFTATLKYAYAAELSAGPITFFDTPGEITVFSKIVDGAGNRQSKLISKSVLSGNRVISRRICRYAEQDKRIIQLSMERLLGNLAIDKQASLYRPKIA